MSASGDLVLVNSFVGANGGNFDPTVGIRATNATYTILYTSIVANEGDGTKSLECTKQHG